MPGVPGVPGATPCTGRPGRGKAPRQTMTEDWAGRNRVSVKIGGTSGTSGTVCAPADSTAVPGPRHEYRLDVDSGNVRMLPIAYGHPASGTDPTANRERAAERVVCATSGDVEGATSGIDPPATPKTDPPKKRRMLLKWGTQRRCISVATDHRSRSRDLVYESKDDDACGFCGRRLRRPSGVVNALSTTVQSPPNAARAFSTPRQNPQAARTRLDDRG